MRERKHPSTSEEIEERRTRDPGDGPALAGRRAPDPSSADEPEEFEEDPIPEDEDDDE